MFCFWRPSKCVPYTLNILIIFCQAPEIIYCGLHCFPTYLLIDRFYHLKVLDVTVMHPLHINVSCDYENRE